nr:hypothetical protein [Tanacetum cinerariifolium]
MADPKPTRTEKPDRPDTNRTELKDSRSGVLDHFGLRSGDDERRRRWKKAKVLESVPSSSYAMVLLKATDGSTYGGGCNGESHCFLIELLFVS